MWLGAVLCAEAKDIASAKPPAVTRDLRRTNFSLGDAVCDFETDYSAGFKGAVPEVELSNHERMESKRVMAGELDLRCWSCPSDTLGFI